jgi:epoxyqueuosine reductase
MTVGDYLKKKLIEKGASIVGFADLASVPAQARKDLPYGIVFGVALDPSIVLGIKDGPTMEYYNEYKRLNSLLNELGDYTEKLLKDNGYAALAKTQKMVVVDDSTKRSELPHKTVATRAGIGWIGKSALLVTEEYGSALRISSVLTNAELQVGTPVNSSKCGDCSICKNCCPGGAVSGKAWEVGMDRDEFYHAFDCRRTALERSGKIGLKETICGLCIVKCPWTQRYLKKTINAPAGI